MVKIIEVAVGYEVECPYCSSLLRYESEDEYCNQIKYSEDQKIYLSDGQMLIRCPFCKEEIFVRKDGVIMNYVRPVREPKEK